MMNHPLNERLREERKRKGLTQEQLAQLLSVSRQTISHWETGRAAPDYESLRLLAEALEISPSHLLGEEEHQAAEETAEETLQPQQSRPSLPRWFWQGAVAVLALCIALFVWMAVRQSDSSAPIITPDFFTESSPRVEGTAWIDIVVYQLPVPRFPSKTSTLYQWRYPIYLREENGVDFTIDLVESWGFFADGNISYGFSNGEDIPWTNGLTSTIPAGKSREYTIGETSHTPISGMGVQITGTDAFGNELVFRKYIPYSLDMQP